MCLFMYVPYLMIIIHYYISECLTITCLKRKISYVNIKYKYIANLCY